MSELGRAWRNLSTDEKAMYEARSRMRKRRFLRMRTMPHDVATSGGDGSPSS